MFFYSALIVAGLIAAIVITLLYYFFSRVGTGVYKTITPYRVKTSNCHLKSNLKRKLYSHKPTPKSLIADESPGMMTWVSTGQPNATSELNEGNSIYSPQKVYSSRPRAKAWKQDTPLLRENKLSEFGKAYKVTRRVEPI